MSNSYGTIRDWVISARKNGLDLSGLDSDKEEDIRKLESLGLPIETSYSCPYGAFDNSNELLARFMANKNLFCVRAIPIKSKKDLPRKPKLGLRNFEECRSFLEEAVRGHEEEYSVLISEFSAQIYGGIIISSMPIIRGEIGKSLVELSHSRENAIVGFELNKMLIGHMNDKISWRLDEKNKDVKKAQDYLIRALMHLRIGDDSFDPFFLRGYFEFVVKEKGDIKFVDYKDNEAYLA